MPKGCGPGKYAVVKHLTESSNQSLPQHLVKRGVTASTIYDLAFDYDFSRVPRDLGTTQMRIDVSNEPGYRDKVVDKAASKRKVKRDISEYGSNHKRWLEDAWREDKNYYGYSHNELHRRWFGSDIIAWLQGLLNGDSDSLDVPIIANRYTDDFTVVLLNENFPNCPIGPGGTEVSGKLNVQATTHVDIETSFGFTLITDLQSLDFSNSYLYFRNCGEVSAKFTADAVATATWQSDGVKLLSADQFGATFSVPGIVTIGPNFVLNGNVKGSLTIAAYFEVNVNIASWDIRQTYPVANNDWDPDSKKTPNRDGTQEILAPEFEYGVSASGAIEAHVKPTVSFGIMFNKKIISSSATVNLVADGHVTFHTDASTGSSGSSFCYGVDAGADLYATGFPYTTPVAQQVQVEGEQNLFFVLSKDIGGSGGGGSRLAIVAGSINGAKGNFFRGQTPGTMPPPDDHYGVRSAKAFQRDVAGVFQYVQQNTIWNKFKETSALIETSPHEFDQAYNWGSRPGHEIGHLGSLSYTGNNVAGAHPDDNPPPSIPHLSSSSHGADHM
ncbi:hypothetical protein DV737_g650, partial [Chaetothyriales sp. CBS 132003]